jgi:hypothetical protein
VLLIPALILAGFVGGAAVAARAGVRRWTLIAGSGFAFGFGLAAQGIVMTLVAIPAEIDLPRLAALWGIGLGVGGGLGTGLLVRPFRGTDAGLSALFGFGLLGILVFGPAGYLAGVSAFQSAATAPTSAARFLTLALVAGGTLIGLLAGILARSPRSEPVDVTR